MRVSNSRRADLVLRNGKIVTMDAAATVVDAVAVAGDRILATGARSDVESLIGEETEVIDLQGRVALPGFIDTHVHIDCTATHTKLAASCHIPPVDYVAVSGSVRFARRDPRLRQGAGRADAQGPVDHRAGAVHPRDGRQLPHQAPTGRGGTASPGDDPLQRTRTAAEQPGAGRPWGSLGTHPLRRNSTRSRRLREFAGIPTSGEPTGVVNECVDWVLGMRNPWPYEALKGAIEATCREAVGFGVTGIHEFVSWPESARIYQELHRAGALPLRVQLCPCIWGLYQTADLDSLVKLGIQTGFGNDWLKFGSVKDLRRRGGARRARRGPRVASDRARPLERSRAGRASGRHPGDDARDLARRAGHGDRGRGGRLEGGSEERSPPPHRALCGRLLAGGSRALEARGHHPGADALQLARVVRRRLARRVAQPGDKAVPYRSLVDGRASCRRATRTAWAPSPRR